MGVIVADKIFRGIAAGMNDNAQLGLQERQMDLQEREAAMRQKVQELDYKLKSGELDHKQAIQQAEIEAKKLGFQAQAERSRNAIAAAQGERKTIPTNSETAILNANTALGNAQEAAKRAPQERETAAMAAMRANREARDRLRMPTEAAQQMATRDAEYSTLRDQHRDYQFVVTQIDGWNRSGVPIAAAQQMATHLARLADQGIVEAYSLAKTGDYRGAEDVARQHGFNIRPGTLAPAADGSFTFARENGSPGAITAEEAAAIEMLTAPVPAITDAAWQQHTAQQAKNAAIQGAVKTKADADLEAARLNSEGKRSTATKEEYRALVDALDKTRTQLGLALTHPELMGMSPSLKREVADLQRRVQDAANKMKAATTKPMGATDAGVSGDDTEQPKATGSEAFLNWLMEATPDTDAEPAEDTDPEE